MKILGKREFNTEELTNALTDGRMTNNLISLGGDIHMMFVYKDEHWVYRPFKLYGHSEVLVENDELVVAIPQSTKSGTPAQAFFNNTDDPGVRGEFERVKKYMSTLRAPKHLQ